MVSKDLFFVALADCLIAFDFFVSTGSISGSCLAREVFVRRPVSREVMLPRPDLEATLDFDDADSGDFAAKDDISAVDVVEAGEDFISFSCFGLFLVGAVYPTGFSVLSSCSSAASFSRLGDKNTGAMAGGDADVVFFFYLVFVGGRQICSWIGLQVEARERTFSSPLQGFPGGARHSHS